MRLPAVIATLGMYLFYQGLGTEVLPQAGGHVPLWLVRLNGSVVSIPAIWFVFLVIAVVWLAITRGSYLRNLLAVVAMTGPRSPPGSTWPGCGW